MLTAVYMDNMDMGMDMAHFNPALHSSQDYASHHANRAMGTGWETLDAIQPTTDAHPPYRQAVHHVCIPL